MKLYTKALNLTTISYIYLFHLPFIKTEDNNLVKDLLCKDSFPNCSTVDMNTDRLVCEIRSDRDETYLMRPSGLSHSTVSASKCPDGTIRKTCFPEIDLYKMIYLCFCHSICQDIQQLPETTWTLWSDLNSPYEGFRYWRKLTFTDDDSLNPIVDEYSNKVYEKDYKKIVSAYGLTGSVYSASSIYGIGHEAYRAHIDFTGSVCSWAANQHLSNHWLQITLPIRFVIVGVFIKQRCDSGNSHQVPTRIKVARSDDGVIWMDVLENVPCSIYSADGQGSATFWFNREYTERYWRVYILAYSGHPSMKCDLMGYSLN